MTNRSVWAPAAVLLLATVLLCVATLGPVASAAYPKARVTSRTLDFVPVAPGAFIPGEDGTDYVNSGSALMVNSGAEAWFYAPLTFPHDVVIVRKLILYVYDNGTGNITLRIQRTDPTTGSYDDMAVVWSEGASTTVPRDFTTSFVDNRRLLKRHAPYLMVAIPSGTEYTFYGARVVYGY